MRKIGLRRIILAAMLLLVLLGRFIPHAGEVYARYVYPTLSAIVSATASIIPFSLDEWIVIITVIFIIAFPFYGHKHKKSKRNILCTEIETMLWMTAWFYIGWGMNYYRDSFFQRADVAPQKVDKQKFRQFLDAYTDSLNAYYTQSHGLNEDSIRSEIKDIYRLVPEKYGLCPPQSYQQPKCVAFNFLYSAVGVHGYMGPFADESHLNSQLFPVEYPSTYAHELAHLLSISNEAEANYWAYQVCVNAKDRYIRYSGYFCILSNVFRNAKSILTKEEFEIWRSRIDKRILEEQRQHQDFWRSQYSPLIADVQHFLFNMLLKGNRISEGTANYDKVVSMIIACPQVISNKEAIYQR